MADEWNVSDDELLERIVAHYRRAFGNSPRAAGWLAERLVDAETAAAFELGWSGRTLGLALPSSDRAAGRQLRGRLQGVGVLRSTGHEQFRGCVVIPVRDRDGHVAQLCGLRIDRPQRRADRPATPADAVLWLPGPATAIFNPMALGARGPDLILACDVADALLWWTAGFRNVIAPGGPKGWPSDLAQQLRSAKVERTLLAMPRTTAGEQRAEALAKELSAAGVESFRVVFPHGCGVLEVAREADDAPAALAERLREATWLGGDARAENGASAGSPVSQPLASPVPPAPGGDGVEVDGGELHLITESRCWRVRGLDRLPAKATGSLRVNLSVCDDTGERVHLDVVDLYAARARKAFVATAAGALGTDEDAIRGELGRVLLACEDRLAELAGGEQARPAAPTLSSAEEEAALELLRDPELIGRIVADIARLGLVGESDNALVTYLAGTSRLLDTPLAVVVQSGSAAGKSTLIDAVLSLMPPEQCLSVSALTGQSLFYLGESEVAHKILSVAEADGASRAAYPLRLLQSDGELSIASTGKDPSGGLVTRTYRSRGPVALFLTTTAPSLDDELANRCIVVGVDEDHGQTRAILAAQRQAETLDGLLARRGRDDIAALHANAQRLLEPIAVVNPLAPTLTFADGRTRARRDQAKYLTLIRAVALLHQHQRPRQRTVRHGVEVLYIEATADDVAVADRLAPVIFGDRVGELAPQSRRLLGLLETMVSQVAAATESPREEVRFTRRQAREHTGWSDFALRRHLARLVDLELLAVQRRGHAFTYAVLWHDGEITAGYDARSDGVAMGSRGQSVQSESRTR